MTTNNLTSPTFREAFLFWLKLGFISFGGPAGQIAIMHDFLVDKKKWISNSRFMHALNYCMLLPGPEAQQLAIYTGWLLHGKKGGVVAGVLFVLPSMLMLAMLSMLYVMFGNVPLVGSLLTGLKAAVMAIILTALIRIARKAWVSRFHIILSLFSFVLIYWWKLPFTIVIIGAILLAVLYARLIQPQTNQRDDRIANDDEQGYFIHRDSMHIQTVSPLRNALKVFFTCFILWCLPVVLIFLTGSEVAFWKSLILFFTEAAFVTFGGAYAVLPFVAQVSVEKFQWLSAAQMLDGLALGETTPGPLIMVLAFVGFMAGYHQYQAGLLAGIAGLCITTWYTFLPGFFFILAGAPFIERSKDNLTLSKALSVVSAVVVGVIAGLTVYLSEKILFITSYGVLQPDYRQWIWFIISVVALVRFKMNLIGWIGISLLMGLIRFFIEG